MRCNQCGHDVADDAAFCPFCGERMAVTPLSPKPGTADDMPVGSSRVDLQACKLEYSIVSPK